MPKDPRIKKVLVIGSGPIIIGQAAEFDYSGTQACRALKAEGIETVLLNSNPATIMTDPDVADLLDAATVEEARSNPELLMVVEQEGLPPAADLEHLLAQLAWPDSVHGAAISVERLVLPPAAQEEAEALTDAAERLAFLQERPDREDIRMVVGVLRGGQSWCVLRSRSHDDDASLYQGERLVPGLVEALEATFL